MKIYARLYGPPDKEEIDERMNKHDWYTKKDDEADVTLFYNSLINAGFVTMKCKAFLKQESGLILGDDRKWKQGGQIGNYLKKTTTESGFMILEMMGPCNQIKIFSK